MRVTVDDRDGAVVVTVTGEVDRFTAASLHTALDRALERTAPVVVVDLAAVTFLSSAGLSALVQLRAATRDRTLRLVGGGRAVTRPIEAAGLADLFSWYPDVATATATGRVD